jgi:hypothetical protein
MAMNPIHRKSFHDRYAMLHEQQVLDYLNQRHAPVPQVILSHLEQSYLEMSHGGADLQAWIRDTAPSPRALSQALALAIRAAMQVAELGVWHLDIALRNFMLHGTESGRAPTVWMIDFANAISDQFPLQKPLWMLPAPHQHLQLQCSLTQDWQAFYARHALSPPEDWQQAFDVPLRNYREDWTSGLQVERIPNRWCILAHGIGQMGLQMHNEMPSALTLHPTAWQDLLNLDQDARAKERLVQCLRQCDEAPDSHVHTPRPRAGHAAPMPPVTPPRPQPAQPTPPAPSPLHIPAFTPPAPTGPAHPALRWAVHTVNIGIIGLGWLMMDVVYTRQGIVLSRLSWLAILVAVVGTSLGGLGTMVSRNRHAWWTLALCSHLASQTLLLLELWVLRVPLFTLDALGACLAMGTALTLSLAFKRPPDTA